MGESDHLLPPLPPHRLAPRFGRACQRGCDAGRRRIGGHAGARHAGLRGDRRRLEEPGRFCRHLPRPLRQRDRPARHHPARIGAGRRNARPCHPGRAGHRGPPLLRSFRHRFPRPVSRHAGERPRQLGRPGRLHHHPAIGQEPVPLQRAHGRAQGQGGVPVALAGDEHPQEGDPPALSRPRLYGRRHLRHHGRRRLLFRQGRQGLDAPRGSHAGGPFQGAGQIRPAHQPARRPRPRQRGAHQHGAGRLHDRGPGAVGPPPPRHRRRPRRSQEPRLFPRLGVRGGQARRRQEGHPLDGGAHHHRHEHPARRRGIAGVPLAPARQGIPRHRGRHRRHRDQRRGARHRRRPRLRRQPVQPRHARAAPGRLLLQALCLRHRDGARLHPRNRRSPTGRSPGAAGRPRTMPAPIPAA